MSEIYYPENTWIAFNMIWSENLEQDFFEWFIEVGIPNAGIPTTAATLIRLIPKEWHTIDMR